MNASRFTDMIMSYVDAAMDVVDRTCVSIVAPAGRDYTPDYREYFKNVILAQFSLSLLLSIWLPDVTGSVVIFGYFALCTLKVEAMILYLGFDALALVVTVVRLSKYSHEFSRGNKAAHAFIVFVSVIAMCLQIVGFFFCHRLKTIFEADDGQGYKSLAETADESDQRSRRPHRFEFNTNEDVQPRLPISSNNVQTSSVDPSVPGMHTMYTPPASAEEISEADAPITSDPVQFVLEEPRESV